MEVFLGVVCVLLLYTIYEMIKQKQKEKRK